MKLSKEKAGFLFVISLLAVLLGVSIYLGITGWYFYSEDNYTTDLQLGKTLQTEIKGNQSTAISQNIQGSFLPGDVLPQVIAVKNEGENSIALRAKVYINSGSNVSLPLNILTSSNWQYNEGDGYYYYNDYLLSQNKATLCTNIVMPGAPILQTTKKYIATFVFEALDEKQNIVNIWEFNPIEK